MYVCVHAKSLVFATLWTVACQPPLSLGFSKKDYCIGLPCPPSGIYMLLQLCLTLCEPMDCNPPDSLGNGIL